MNLNHVLPIYQKSSHAIILLDSRLGAELPEFRIVHQQVMDALVQYMGHCAMPFSDQKINSLGKDYILRVAPCK